MPGAIEANVFCDSFVVTAVNVGARPTAEKAVTLTDVVPAGVSVRFVGFFRHTGITLHDSVGGSELVGDRVASCTETPVGGGETAQCGTSPSGGGTVVKVTLPSSYFSSRVEPERHLLPEEELKLYVSVVVNEPAVAGTLVNEASISGGGVAASASASSENTLEAGLPAFGLSLFDAPLLAADGSAETQAAGHPYELSTKLGLRSAIREGPQGERSESTSVQDVRDVAVDLPVGVAGSALSTPRCTLAQLASEGEREEGGISGCPLDTIIGRIHTYQESDAAPQGAVYNLVPERGYAAEFGFVDIPLGTHVLYVSLAPTPAGYVVRTTSREIPEIAIDEIVLSAFGDPAARMRGRAGLEGGGPYVYGTKASDVPTFTEPADCSGAPLVSTAYTDSWLAPGSYNADGTPNLEDPRWVKSTFEAPPVTGCEALAGLFTPTLAASLGSSAADSPSGLDVDLRVPQSEGVEALGTPPLRRAVVALPEGLSVNPSSVNRLGVCSEAQIGWLGKTPATGESELEDFNAAPPACPHASQVGTVDLETPALPSEACKEATLPLAECPSAERQKTPITGEIYVAAQGENPFGSLLALYIVVDDPQLGLVVKIPVKVEADPVTGRLSAVVEDAPQFPFSLLRTHFFGGNTASLKTPPTCGSYTVGSTLTPWSAPQSGPPATPSSGLEVVQGVGGGACGAPGFAPAFTAATTSNAAGGFSPLSVTFSRNDGEQDIGGASVTMPPGVLGILNGIPLCGEPQAASGTCGEGSLIGQATVAVGSGPEPYWVHGARVYLTGPYNGGPFGLSVVIPTTAGPYTLTGNAGPGREVVRASIRVDPSTARVDVVSDPLPSVLQGIPLDVRAVNVTVDRPGFIFNATSCDPSNATGTFTSTSGASAVVSSRYQAAGCAGLPFKPSFKVSTQAKTSKKSGASLDVRVTSGRGQANIGKVAVSLPKQLPSRLTTIQQACPEAVFAANPASCPAGSNIGIATAHTPVLANPVAGPAYLVSHGGAAFPDLVVVLQGEGVTLDLVGSIDIKKGVTSSAFNSVPDAPVDSFELKLPEGPHSGLTAVLPAKAKGSLCGTSLTMPTTITGQNGAQVKQSTKIAVSGCAKPKHRKIKRKKTKQAKHGVKHTSKPHKAGKRS